MIHLSSSYSAPSATTLTWAAWGRYPTNLEAVGCVHIVQNVSGRRKEPIKYKTEINLVLLANVAGFLPSHEMAYLLSSYLIRIL